VRGTQTNGWGRRLSQRREGFSRHFGISKEGRSNGMGTCMAAAARPAGPPNDRGVDRTGRKKDDNSEANDAWRRTSLEE
jgi:hypothetical protein